MPSTNQSNQGGRSYDSEAGRFFAADVDIEPIIKGIQDRERAISYHREAHKRDARKEIKEMIAKKLRELD